MARTSQRPAPRQRYPVRKRVQRSSVLPGFRRRAMIDEPLSRASTGPRPASGKISVACRLPSVIVPVLSSSSVSTSPAASTARPLIASTFRCMTRSMPAMPIAESRPPIVVGMRHTSRAISTVSVVRAGVDRKRRQRRDRDEENDRQTRQQNRQRDLVRRLLALCAFDEGDHPIEEAFAGIRRYADDDVIGKYPRSAGNRAAVAAGFTNDRCRLAGDRRLVDGCRPAITSPSPAMISPAGRRTSPLRSVVRGTTSSLPSSRSFRAVVSDWCGARSRLALYRGPRRRLRQSSRTAL